MILNIFLEIDRPAEWLASQTVKTVKTVKL